MKITIRQSVRNEIREQIPALLETALGWMRGKYPLVNFDNTEYIFSAGFSRSRYFRNEVTNGKYLSPVVCISVRAKTCLYIKKRLGVNPKKNYVFTGSPIQTVCAIIHELTHHTQYEMKIRQGNETDTTANELEYLKQYHPKYYNKLVIPSFRVK